MEKEIKELLNILGSLLVDMYKEEMAAVGLKDSKIINEVTYSVTVDNTILIQIPTYADYIESGRQPFARKVPIAPLLEWMKRKRIAPGNENRVVWAIQMAIYKNGIKPRPFQARALSRVETVVENFTQLEFNNIISQKLTDILNG